VIEQEAQMADVVSIEERVRQLVERVQKLDQGLWDQEIALRHQVDQTAAERYQTQTLLTALEQWQQQHPLAPDLHRAG